MKQQARERKSLALKIVLGVIGIIAACAIAFFAYVGDYYHADDTANAALESSPAVSVVGEAGSSDLVFMPQDPQAGLVFYPGCQGE